MGYRGNRTLRHLKEAAEGQICHPRGLVKVKITKEKRWKPKKKGNEASANQILGP